MPIQSPVSSPVPIQSPIPITSVAPQLANDNFQVYTRKKKILELEHESQPTCGQGIDSTSSPLNENMGLDRGKKEKKIGNYAGERALQSDLYAAAQHLNFSSAAACTNARDATSKLRDENYKDNAIKFRVTYETLVKVEKSDNVLKDLRILDILNLQRTPDRQTKD
nr:Retrovirus-related Pol polyprotein from transposon RE1 [Ipomoea batatas]